MAQSDSPEFFDAKSDIEISLINLNLTDKDIQFLLEQGHKFLEKPDILSKRLKIPIDLAKSAIKVLKSEQEPLLTLIQDDDVHKIQTCLEEYPEVYKYGDIALISDVDDIVVSKYFEQHPLTLKQKEVIQEKFDKGLSITDISNELSYKVESVIIRYFQQYSLDPVEEKNYTEIQREKIANIFSEFETYTFSLDEYRTIFTSSFDALFNLEFDSKLSQEILIELLPLIFYYLKCSLPFEDIQRLLSGIPLTTHDIFHIIFQRSNPVLRGLCIEHYSFSNPVPLYYPKLKPPESESSRKVEFEICKELWYCLEQYNGLISFGLGRASWNGVGKSSLLDLIFETDFVKGSPQSSAFHLGSIDIQLTRNLFGETNESNPESTKWAYIDCHSYSDLRVIQVMCSHLDVALIHVCYSDYIHNRDELDRELSLFRIKYIYVFLRDSDREKVDIERIDGGSYTYVHVPKISQKDSIPYSLVKELKTIGHEILHLRLSSRKSIQSEFVHQIIQDLNCSEVKHIEKDCQLVRDITEMLSNKGNSFLNYYLDFVEFMSSFYQAFFELDQNEIDRLNQECGALDKKLKTNLMGNLVKYFNNILEQENFTLILYRLSRELSQHSNLLQAKSEEKAILYNLDILWRENLLFYKYGQDCEEDQFYKDLFRKNYSKHVGSGEPFELIDGDNLRFFNKEIDSLLSQFYKERKDFLEKLSEGKTTKINQAPIVISIIGPQSSGKSTLLNYCFGSKFLTSAGRCTRGVYGSLSNLDRPVNLSQSFLILDTEGLDAIERENIKDTSMIHFDRTMVLFCLAVSQVVIINVKGDIGSEMQNLLQICAYSLNRLKVSKVKAPKIFFVLNQQADPDPNKHLNTINLLMEKLNSESDLLDTEGVKISDLIQVSRENLFVLPTAFYSQQMNGKNARLFDSDVIKLSPTIDFADKCFNLRLTIINKLDGMPLEDRAPFQTMGEWMEMAGVIWDTIIKYQDIVKYRNVDELKCCNKLDKIVADLMERHLYSHRPELKSYADNLCIQIGSITTYAPPDTLTMQYMVKFDEIFEQYMNLCMRKFKDICKKDIFLLKMSHVCEERELHIRKLIYSVRKQYEDQIKLQIKSILIEVKLSENMKLFLSCFTENISEYIKYSAQEQEIAFKQIWDKTFGTEEIEEEEHDCDDIFSNLYSLFRMEYHAMENKRIIYDLFRNHNFNMDEIIKTIRTDALTRFLKPNTDPSERFIYPIHTYNAPIKDMVPYNGRPNYSYLSQKSLYKSETNWWTFTCEIHPFDWIPPECKGLLEYCSGYYNEPDIIWNPSKTTQITNLASALKDPDDPDVGSWVKFMIDFSDDVIKLIRSNNEISPAVVKKIVYALSFRIKLLNHEIGYIHAGLSNCAERSLSTLVFAFAFKSILEKESLVRVKNKLKRVTKKQDLLEYFDQKIEIQKMKEGNWDREEMKKSDRTISKKYCLDFIYSIKRGLITNEQHNLRNLLENACSEVSLTHESLSFLAYERANFEVSQNPEEQISDPTHFVVQYICNRNKILRELFREKWKEVEDILYPIVSESLRSCFNDQVSTLKSVLNSLLQNLKDNSKQEAKGFYSDYYFEFVNLEKCGFIKTKDIKFKAMTTYLRYYLDPSVTREELRHFLLSGFEVDGIRVKTCEAYSLPLKPSEPLLDEFTFRKLVNNTEIFNNSELLFNIYEYIQHFISVLRGYQIELRRNEFEEITQFLKDEFETKMLGCPNQCPSCGKFCEREMHMNEGPCQIKTGHQISSMGGRVWNEDKDNTAILFMCDDYKDHHRVSLPGREMKWGQFKDRCCREWNWNLPIEEKYKNKQKSNPEFMKNVWNKFGRCILQYQYEVKNNPITFVPYSTHEDVVESLLPIDFSICFVVDGTGSMSWDLSRVRLSVGQLIKSFKSSGDSAQFRVIIYRDHCDSKLIESFPGNRNFTQDHITVVKFLEDVVAQGGGDGPEAVLDGLATAATQSEWLPPKSGRRVINKIIHIFDAPPHGNFPNYLSHSSCSSKRNCCCCNRGTLCQFDWDRDVWRKFKEFGIKYHAINTTPTKRDVSLYNIVKKTFFKWVLYYDIDLLLSNYERKMREELGDLCDNFQVVGKEVVNDAILKIFVDFKVNDDNSHNHNT